jgi:4-amino-4-deoxy-L-arabinose transferase-like glycosyltransferase
MRSRLRRVPAAAWACAAIAFLNAAAWSILTPPFQGRDEVDHFAYVAQLAETGTLPENGRAEGVYSPAEALVLQGLHYYQVRFTPTVPAISSKAEQQTLTEDLDAHASLVGSGEAGVATSEPPLYYALEIVPFVLGRGDVLTQLELMRLSGALLGALTTLLIFLFLREILPGTPWATTIGALCVALQPLFAFMSGSVNPDTLLFTISAALFLCLARAFRRGLTRPLAVTLGLLIAAGCATKLNFAGVAAGVFASLLILALRERSRGPKALLSVAIAAGIGVAPLILYELRSAVAGRPTSGVIAGALSAAVARSPLNELSYMWELYLPRLPGMTPYFAGTATYREIWFDRFVGLYGWMDTTFPGWVDSVALVPAVAIALLCGRELFARREALRARMPELGAYLAITVGVMAMIGALSYGSDAVGHHYALGEPRYLLPMLALLGAAIALATRGAGRRWAPVVGSAMVVLFLAHDVFSQLQVIARYYG